MSKLLLAIFISLLSSVSIAQEQVPSSYGVTSLQGGIEYDSNVFKAFGHKSGDFVARLLAKNRGRKLFSPTFETGWNVQLGGKKFFTHTEQDVMILYSEVPLIWNFSSTFGLSLVPDFKYQNESNAYETPTAVNAVDVNEDYYSTNPRLFLRGVLPYEITVEPNASYTFFHFDPQANYSFHREQGGITIRKSIGQVFAVGTQYEYSQQQFLDSPREDQSHEISGFVQYLELPYFSLRYTFEKSDSTVPQLAFNDHRITFLFSYPFGQKQTPPGFVSNEDNPGTLFAIHLLSTLQLKDFPSVFDYTPEGVRFLVTGAEDDNFNSVLVKFSYHPSQRWVIEAKFTRYSNAFSSQQDSFSRELYYGGARLVF